MKKLDRNTRITSTSDVTIEDLIGAVAESLPEPPCRENIEKIVRETVKACAAKGLPEGLRVLGGGRVVRVDAPADGGVAVTINPGCGGDCTDADNVVRSDDACTGNAGTVKGIKTAVNAPRQSTYRTVGMAVDGDLIFKSGEKLSPKLAKASAWYNLVLQNGELWTPYTSRRFLPAQYLALMHAYSGNIDAAIACRYSMRDMFKLLDNEIEKLIFMKEHWKTAFLERSKFLSVADVKKIFCQYLDGLKKNLNDRDRCTFTKRSGEFFRKIQGEGRIVLWTRDEVNRDGANGMHTESVVIKPSEWLEETNAQIESALVQSEHIKCYEDALEILRKHMPKISMGTFVDADKRVRYWLPKAWKECFKKQGAYYTLKSLIVNRHVRYTTESGSWSHKVTHAAESAREGLDQLKTLQNADTPAYVVHAILKKSIEASRFEIGKFLRSIRRH